MFRLLLSPQIPLSTESLHGQPRIDRSPRFWNEESVPRHRVQNAAASSGPRRCLHTTGNIYHTAKDQYGCRFLQKMLEDGNPQCIARILEEVRDPSRFLGPICA